MSFNRPKSPENQTRGGTAAPTSGPKRELSRRLTYAGTRRQMSQPSSTAEQLDAITYIARCLGSLFIRSTAGPMVIAYLTILVLQNAFLPAIFSVDAGRTSPIDQISQVTSSVIAALLFGLPLMLGSLAYAQSLIALLTTQFLLGETPSLPKAQGIVLDRWKLITKCQLLLAARSLVMPFICLVLFAVGSFGEDSTLTGVSSTLAMFTLLLSIVWVPSIATHNALVPIIAVTEDVTARQSFKRNSELLSQVKIGSVVVHRSGKELMGQIWALIFLLAVVSGFGYGSLLSMFDIAVEAQRIFQSEGSGAIVRSIITMIPWFLALWCAVCIWSVAIAVVYFDRRIRLEGLDIDLLAKEANHRTRGSDFLV